MIRINCGGEAYFSATKGSFLPDAYYSPVPGNTFKVPYAIIGTEDDVLYQSERHGTNKMFSYNIPTKNGENIVILHFAEIYYNLPKKRIFDISINGTKVKTAYDIYAKVGQFVATTETFVVNVTNGLVKIDLSSANAGGVDLPKLSAIEIIEKPIVEAPTTTTSTTSTTKAPPSTTTTTSTTTLPIVGAKLPVNEGFITLKVDTSIKGISTDASPLGVDWDKAVFTSENGKKWRVTVDNNGVLKTIPINN